jgi:hypothetical protein
MYTGGAISADAGVVVNERDQVLDEVPDAGVVAVVSIGYGRLGGVHEEQWTPDQR